MLILLDLISDVLFFQLKTHCRISCLTLFVLHKTAFISAFFSTQFIFSKSFYLIQCTCFTQITSATQSFSQQRSSEKIRFYVVKRAYIRGRKEERNPFSISHQNPSSLWTKLFLRQAKPFAYSSLQSNQPKLLFHFTMQLVFQFHQSFIGYLLFWPLWSFSHSAFSSMLLLAQKCCFWVFPATTESQIEICHLSTNISVSVFSAWIYLC